MSLFNLVGLNGIVICEEKDLSVDAALDITCSKLLEQGKIKPSYVKAIKAKHKEIGAYYVLAPKIAMPHARPEDGVNQACLQVTVFKNGVDLESKENGEVYVSITLAATDSGNHIQTIMALSDLLQNDTDIEAIIAADSELQIAEILKRY